MDRAVSEKSIQARKRSRLLWISLTLFGLIAGVLLLRMWLKNRVDANRIQIVAAEMGPIENSLTASGEVIPAFEQVISSSIEATIQEVLVEVGTTVDPEMPILRLDKSFSQLEYQKLQQEWELKKNGIIKLELELKKKAFDLQITDSTKALEIQQLVAELQDSKRLEQVGGGTKENIEQIELQLQVARLEKRRLEYNLSIEQQQTQASLRELEILSEIQQNSMRLMREKLKRAEVVAARPGVLTWVNENLGTSVREGEILARIANLSAYKVLGTCSDLYAERLRVGMAVWVQVNRDTRLAGTLVNIRPTVENNVISFDIQLAENNHAALRPNMRTEVFILTERKAQVVKVPNGPAFQGGMTQEIFVVEGDRAIRRKVVVGLQNVDEVEIESGLQAGEQVIISDMKRFEGISEIIIK